MSERDDPPKKPDVRDVDETLDSIPEDISEDVTLIEVGLATLATQLPGGTDPSVRLRAIDEETVDDLADDQLGDERYRVLKVLGEGGMGIVYLAEDLDLKRKVALKMVRDDAQEHASRFLEEAQILGQLEHPNILPLYDLTTQKNGRPVCTLRYLSGHTLKGLIQGLRQGDSEVADIYSLTRLMQIFLDIARAIEYAHARGVIHRDLKPDNVRLGKHGEVQVLDWGMAKVLDRTSVDLVDREATRLGHVIGTPAYMAPEQALGQDADERADIYALGVILYELLALVRPFSGSDPVKLITSVLRDDPKTPREAAPARNIPVELEQACLRAMARDRDERTASVEQLGDEIQEWIEAAADKERRHLLAEEKAAEGQAKLRQLQEFRDAVSVQDEEIAETRRRFKSWQSVEEKAVLYAKLEQLEETRIAMVRLSSETLSTLQAALAFERQNATAREALADYYWDRLLVSEAGGDGEGVAFHSGLVAAYHDGKYSRELSGDGSFTLESDPPGAEVELYDLVEKSLQLVPDNGRSLGETPLEPVPLSMGSYVAIVSKGGYRDARYPISIARNAEWKGKVKLYREEEIGAEYVQIPDGPFILGGDPETRGWSLPRSVTTLPDFFIARRPVTVAEYVEFLNGIASVDPEEAERRAIRRMPSGGSYLETSEDGTIQIPTEDEEGDVWDPDWPVFAISWEDAAAYCRWRAEVDGRPYRLPTEIEWEKAARSVDGRWYPWGFKFDASLCNIRESRRERNCPVSVVDYPTDVSVYGVTGMAGNMRNWTTTIQSDGEDDPREGRVVRGGAWYDNRVNARCADRDWNEPTLVIDYVGFRLAYSPAG